MTGAGQPCACPGCGTTLEVPWRALPCHLADGRLVDAGRARGRDLCPWSLAVLVDPVRFHYPILHATGHADWWGTVPLPAGLAPLSAAPQAAVRAPSAAPGAHGTATARFVPLAAAARPLGSCAAACGQDVRVDDYAVRETGGQRVWHAWCWHATDAPGQGDLLDLLSLQRPSMMLTSDLAHQTRH